MGGSISYPLDKPTFQICEGTSDTVFNLNPPELELGLGYDNYGEWVDCSRAVSG